MTPRVIGICGSPRKSGNTDSLLDRALEGALSEGAFIEKIYLNDLAIKPCQACGRCHRTGACGTRDDMAHIYRKIVNSSAVIVASPIYFGTVTAQLKAMIDRFHSAWVAKHVLKLRGSGKKRKGYFLSAAGSSGKRCFTDARRVVRNFFATADIVYAGELFCGGLDDKGSVIKDKEAMKKAFSLGKASAKKYDI